MTFIMANEIPQHKLDRLECCSAVLYWALCPQTTVVCEHPQKKRVTVSFHLGPPRGLFLERGSVKSDTLSWACNSLSHCGCEAVTLLWVLSVRLLILSIWHHPIPVALSVGTFLQNCQNTFEIMQNWVEAAVVDRDATVWNGGTHFFLIFISLFMWHLSIMMVSCWYSLQKWWIEMCRAMAGTENCLPAWADGDMRIKQWPNVSVKSPQTKIWL